MSFDVFRLPNGDVKEFRKNLYLLGTSEHGIPYEPILIKNEGQLEQCFGNYGSLINAWREANETNPDVNIYLVKINGGVSSYTFKDLHDNTITFSTKEANPIYNKIQITWEEDYLEILNPNELGGQAYRFGYSDYSTIEELMIDINHLCIENKIHVHLSSSAPSLKFLYFIQQVESTNTFGVPVHLTSEDNTTNISKNKLHNNLQIAYNILEGEPIDIIIPVEAYFDDVYDSSFYGENSGYGVAFFTAGRDYLTLPHKILKNRSATFHGQLIEFCKLQLNSGIITHGVMAFNPLDTIEDIIKEDAYIAKVVFATCFKDRFDLIEGIAPNAVDNGKFVSVVLGELEYNIQENVYYNNGYIAYGTMLASTLDNYSLTNKLVSSAKGLRYNLSNKESKILSDIGIVTFRESLLKEGIVVTNAVTTAVTNSPYHYMSNVRISQVIMTYFKEVVDSYIGENIHMLQASRAVEKALDQLVSSLKEEKALRDLKYEFNYIGNGYAMLKVEIKPLYTLEYITASGKFKM